MAGYRFRDTCRVDLTAANPEFTARGPSDTLQL